MLNNILINMLATGTSLFIFTILFKTWFKEDSWILLSKYNLLQSIF